MTATFLHTELLSLIQDSRKKYPEVRTAAEKSLNELKALSITSEAQVVGDLRRKAQFVDAFVLGCRTKNLKLAISSVICLQRLTASRAIPRDRLGDVLAAFRDAAGLSSDVQLKILQTLPSLLQLYAEDLQDDLLATTLEVCVILQGSKTQLVSTTAAATFQQLIHTIFEKVVTEDGGREVTVRSTITMGNESVELGSAAFDAFRVFSDLCALINEVQPQYMHVKDLPLSFTLEVVGSALMNCGGTFASHHELLEICRNSLVPALIRVVQGKPGFPLTVRALRIVRLLVRSHIDQLATECEDLFESMLQLLEPNPSQQWRRTLCMEVFGDICSDFALTRHLFDLYDCRADKKPVIGTLIAIFVRISSENAALIGLGRQSTAPQSRIGSVTDQSVTSYESTGIGGVVGNVSSTTAESAGISIEWSTIQNPCLDYLDQGNPPDLPPTYIYTLILTCLSDIADGLSKFVMPLSVPRKEQLPKPAILEDDFNDSEQDQIKIKHLPTAHKYQRLVNPLKNPSKGQLEDLKLSAGIIEQCWPAFLATCSTFLNAALDSDYYHTLVRAVQKMTQVAGVLELVTARDALLTCLSKAALPAISFFHSMPFRDRLERQGSIVGSSELRQDGETKSPQATTSRLPLDAGQQMMTVRNMLCLRALLNLGIALGPTLSDEAWFILIETLEQAELLFEVPQTGSGGIAGDATAASDAKTNLATEVMAVRTASKRMFESTRGYSDEYFHNLLGALFKLASIDIQSSIPEATATSISPTIRSPGGGRMHQASRSMSGLLKQRDSHEAELQFVLGKVNDLSRINLHRFAAIQSTQVSWELIVTNLLKLLYAPDSSPETRLKCATTIDSVAMETLRYVELDAMSEADVRFVHNQCLGALAAQLMFINKSSSTLALEDNDITVEIHVRLLTTLESILGQCGESVGPQWDVIFNIIHSIFETTLSHKSVQHHTLHHLSRSRPRASKLLRVAFRATELIINDFLASMDARSIARLVGLLWSFGSQVDDLNISLSTATFFWNIETLILERMQFVNSTISFTRVSVLDNEAMDEEASPVRVWEIALAIVSNLCLDERDEVRQSSILMMLKILDASSPKLGGKTWNCSIENILLHVLKAYHQIETSHDNKRLTWQASAIQVYNGVVELMLENLLIIANDNNFYEMWRTLVAASDDLLTERSLKVSTAVFTGFGKLLHKIRELNRDEQDWALAVLALWRSHQPVDIGEVPKDKSQARRSMNPVESNQEAYAMHILCFIELLHVFGLHTLQYVDLNQIIKSLKDTIFTCCHPRYTSDLRKISQEQEAATNVLSLLQPLICENWQQYMKLLLDFVEAPLRLQDPTDGQNTDLSAKAAPTQRPTFVAFSKKCIEMYAQALTSGHPRRNNFGDSMMATAIRIFANICRSKYTALPQGPSPPLWQYSGKTALIIATFAINEMQKGAYSEVEEITTFFSALTDLTESILRSGGLESLQDDLDKSQILSDESFDMDTVSQLHKSIFEALGSSAVPTDVQKSYIVTIFHASLTAKPFLFDLTPDLLKSPLGNFSNVRMGTVCTPVFPKRDKICYTALDMLFELVAKANDDDNDNESGEEGLTLARIAAPYVLLRIAHTLKTFLADQPLRSLEALPGPLQKEMITILTKCLQLRSEDGAFIAIYGDSANLGRDGKNHLRLLYGLILRVQDCWRKLPRMRDRDNWQDGENGKKIEKLLGEWCRVIGDRWEANLT